MFGEAIGQAVGALFAIDVGTLVAAGIGLFVVKYVWDHIEFNKK